MAANESTSPRILLVEDEALIALSEATMLKKHGYEVVTVSDGEKAIEAVDSDPGISLILMDIELGGEMNGTEAAARILQKHELPIAFLSSHTEPEVVEKTERITSYGYIVKNSGETVLLASIRMAFRLFYTKKEQQQQKELLREINTNLSTIVERLPLAVFMHDMEGRIVQVNNTAEKYTGYTNKELLNMSVADIDKGSVTRNDLETVWRRLRYGDHQQFDSVHSRKDGSTYPVKILVTAISYENEPVILAVVEDVTEQKKAQDELQEKKALLQLITDNMTDLVALTDTDGTFRFVSSSHNFLGYDIDELFGKSAFDLVHPDDVTRVKTSFTEWMHSNVTQRKEEVRYRCTDGSHIWIEIVGKKLFEEDGEPKELLFTSRDITERKQHEQKIKEMYARLQTIVDNVPFLISEISLTGHWIMVNAANCKLLGLSREDLIGKGFYDVLPEHIAKTFQNRVHQIAKTGKQLTVDDRLELGGKEQMFRTVLSPVVGDDGAVQSIVGVGYDVSDQLQALQQKDRLMREVNHRVKNNLGMVSSLVSLKDSSLGDGVDLSDIRRQIDAIIKVHEALQQSEDVRNISLKPYLEDILSAVLQSFRSRGITIDSQIPDISVGTKAALPLGLIINETATNAIKHGFLANNEEIRFTVRMEKDEENYVLTICNTGGPIPEHVDLENPHTLGLQLISALVSQLQGELEIKRAPHPTLTIRIAASHMETD